VIELPEVTVTLPASLASALGVSRELKIEAQNLRELIRALGERCGTTLTQRLLSREGGLNPFVNIYVNGRNVRFTGGLETPLKEGDEILIIPAIAGG
jgi:adenylyltransferase/sulfurtransferase